jgi:hypothetical protein
MAWTCIWLVLFPLFPVALSAQQAAAPAGGLTLTVIEGEGAVHNIRRRAAQNVVVQVAEENRPVAGAAVVFTLPNQGAGATFPDGSKTLMITSDDQGRAIARGLTPNNIPGKFGIHVNASIGGRTARTDITQFNMEVRQDGGGGGKIAAVVVLLGAAAAAGVVVALRKQTNNGGPITPPISLTPGTGTVGTPQ